MVQGKVPIPALGVIAALHAATAALHAQRLDRIPEARAGARLPPGWELHRVADAAPASSRVVGSEGADDWLQFQAEGGAASQFWIELEAPLQPVGGRLEWRWRVDETVPGARLRDPANDDSPARVFVVFGRPGLLKPPRTIFYSWGNEAREEGFFRSHVNDRLVVIELRSGEDPTGIWLDERRDPWADFREAFGEKPPEVRAVGFMIDTDQTKATATSGLARIEWKRDEG